MRFCGNCKKNKEKQVNIFLENKNRDEKIYRFNKKNITGAY